MTDDALVVDLGTATTKAMLVRDGTASYVAEPRTGGNLWPTAAYRTADRTYVGTLARRSGRADPRHYSTERVSAWMLTAIARATSLTGPVPRRLALVVEADRNRPWLDDIFDNAERLGFEEVDVIRRPVAAAFNHVNHDRPGLALVFDLGERGLQAGLVQATADRTRLLGHATADDCGGRAADAVLAAHVLGLGGEALGNALRAGHLDPAAAACVAMDFADAIRELKHDLSRIPVTADRPVIGGPVVEVRRQDFEALLAPLVERAVATARRVLDRAGTTVEQLDAVVLAGGMALVPYVERTVDAAFPDRLVPSRAPEFGAVAGAAAVVRDVPRPAFAPTGPDRQTPLRWDAAGARLVRWLVEPGESFGARAELAVVRTEDGGLRRLRAPEHPGVLVSRHVESGAVLADGAWAATISRFRADLTVTPVLEVPLGAVGAVAFSPDGSRIAAGVDGAVHLLNQGGKELWRLAHRGPVHAVAFDSAWQLWTGGTDRAILRWDVRSGRQRRGLSAGDPVLGVALSPDGDLIAVAAGSPLTTALYRTDGLQNVWSRNAPGGSVTFSPDGARVAMVRDGGVVLVDAGGRATPTPITKGVRTDGRARLAFSPDGALLAVADSTGFVQCCETAGPDLRWQTAEPGGVTGFAFAPTGDRLIIAGDHITVLDAVYGEAVARHEVGRPITAMALAADGGTLALGTGSGVTLLRLEEAR